MNGRLQSSAMGLDEGEPTAAGEPIPTTELDPAKAAGVEPLAYSAEPDTVDYEKLWDDAPTRRSWWLPATVFIVAVAVAGVIGLSIARNFATGTEQPAPVEQPKPESLTVPATAPNGTYRLTFDLANATISKDDGAPKPVKVDREPISTWSFTTSCTATECIASGRSLNDIEQIDARSVTEDVMHRRDDGAWESVKPHLRDTCTDGSEFGSTWTVWTPVSAQSADQFRGVEIGILRILPGGGACSSEGGKYRVETPFTATLVGASTLPPLPQPPAAPPVTVTATPPPPPPTVTVPPLATPQARIAEPIICSLHNEYPQMQPGDLALTLVDRGIYNTYDEASLVVGLVLKDGCHGI
ncbi:hypothetical protein C5U48_13050 [Mycolicibacter virginiensis]|uniref:Uncharacterized protein n=2 Tax=Mycolicibacter virginiensis TaxID=1795032 RepID=A0A9X7IMJ3_9MYCO|nr:hypothetical protein C5U48_13050 [Mycolicibacter virginiensis]